MGLFRMRRQAPRTVSRLADDAANVLEQRRLARGVLRDGRGGLCLWGAINMADHGTANHHYERKRHARIRAVAARVSPEYMPHDWSNAQSHHGPHVQRLRDVARTAREEEFARDRARVMGGPFSRAAQAPIPAHPHQPVLSGSVMDEPLGLEAPVDDRFPWEQDTARDVLGVGTGPW
jgi:hypothetical protein